MNRNALYSQTFVDELARAGLRHVVLSPGSRNTPLVLAFAQESRIRKHSILDERSAGFYALGLALATDAPVALVCSSGSAAANYFPAVVEAHQSRVPLLVLTADRPPELRHSGANQTVDQIKLYGDYALWFVDAALPEATPSAVALRNLRTLANRAYATANGLKKGVVHVNFPFRKPLEPAPEEPVIVPSGAAARDDAPFTQITRGIVRDGAFEDELVRIITEHANGWLIAGRRVHAPALQKLAAVSGYPVLIDPDFALTQDKSGLFIRGYDTFLPILAETITPPDLVIRFGDLPVSAKLNDYLNAHPPKVYAQISASGTWSDDNHRLTHLVQADENGLCDTVSARLSRRENSHAAPLIRAESTTWRVIAQAIAEGDYFDGGVLYDVVDLLPDGAILFTGNSLSVRHLDQFGKLSDKSIRAFANRGASGIDGNISTALGLGAADIDKPLVAVVGDVTLYHDMNGLMAVKRCGVPITLIVLNNNGGGIFHRLPVSGYDPAFTDYFLTAHGLDFRHAAALYGLDYGRIDGNTPDGRAAFREQLQVALNRRPVSTLIEVRTDARVDLARRADILRAVKAAL